MSSRRDFSARIAASLIVGLAAGIVTWVFLGPYEASAERFLVTFTNGTTIDLMVGPDVRKDSLTQPPTSGQTAGPLWNQPVRTVDGPVLQQRVTLQHPERDAVSVRNAAVACLATLALTVSCARVRNLSP